MNVFQVSKDMAAISAHLESDRRLSTFGPGIDMCLTVKLIYFLKYRIVSFICALVYIAIFIILINYKVYIILIIRIGLLWLFLGGGGLKRFGSSYFHLRSIKSQFKYYRSETSFSLANTMSMINVVLG